MFSPDTEDNLQALQELKGEWGDGNHRAAGGSEIYAK